MPTDKGYRFYVNMLNDDTALALPAGRGEKGACFASTAAGSPERMIRNAVDTLVELTHNLGLATIGNQLYIAGLSNLFGQPEFLGEHNQVQQVARLLDNLEPLAQRSRAE